MVYAFLEHHIGTKRHTHVIEPSYEVSDEAAEAAMKAFVRMSSGEPLQYVTGLADFYGRQFRVTPDVLIPRPETELLCNTVINRRATAKCSNGPLPQSGPWPTLLPQAARGKSPLDCLPNNSRPLRGGAKMPFPHSWQIASQILDLCTGSGCIAWTLALELAGAKVTAVDISDGALAVASSQDFAEEMARTGALAPTFIKADVLAGPSAFNNPEQRFDILVSNPPYVMNKEKPLMRRNVLEHEPGLALFVPDEDPLLFYRAVSDWALHYLKSGGLCMVEINEALGEETADVFRNAGFKDVQIVQDLNSKDRFVTAIKQ